MKKAYVVLGLILLTATGYGQDIKKVKITELEKMLAESKTPLIINFWATWCMPCIEIAAGQS